MNRLLPTVLPTMLLLAPVAAADDRYLATAEGVALAFTAEQIAGRPASLSVDKHPGRGSLEAPSREVFVYTPDDGFTGVDALRLVEHDGPHGGGVFEVFVSVAPARIPVAGDWNGDGVTEVGRYDSGEVQLYLYQQNVPHPPRFDYTYPAARPGWRPFAGDFDGDGFDEVGLYDPATGVFHLLRLPPNPVPPPHGVNELLPYAELAVAPSGAGEIPVAGDWSADGGDDGIGLFVPGPPAGFYLWENLDDATPFEAAFIVLAPGTDPVAGDWDGDGRETVGLYDPATGEFHLLDDHSGGPADEVRRVLRAAGLERLPVAGDWFDDGEPAASVGLFDPVASATSLYEHGTLEIDSPVVVVIHTNPPCDPSAAEGCRER